MDETATELTANQVKIDSPGGKYSLILTYVSSVPFGPEFHTVKAIGFTSPLPPRTLIGEVVWTPDGNRFVATVFHDPDPSKSPDIELVVVSLLGEGTELRALARCDHIFYLLEVTNEAAIISFKGTRQCYPFPAIGNGS
jgi:hypothetical protein